MTALAGINSSEADQRAGKNEHLRSFKLEYPPRRRPGGDSENIVKYSGRTEALGQTALFSKPQGEKDGVYQRIIRLSPTQSAVQRPVGAVATCLAAKGEIVVFRSDPSLKNIDTLGRIDLEKDEASDLDIWAGEESDTAVLAYCTSLKVFFYAIEDLSGKASKTEPISIYTVPAPEGFKDPARPKLRSLRFLSPRHILLLANRPQRAGADLIVLKLDQLGSAGNSTLQKRLNKSTKAAVGLEVCFLSASSTGERQIVIAVAGQDSSIELLTMDYSPKSGLGRFKPYATIRDIHPASITNLAFSTFQPPPPSSSPDHDYNLDQRPPPTQTIKLASVSVGQTVVIHTLTLRHTTTKTGTRYILAPPPLSNSKAALQNTFSAFMAIVVIGICAFLLQAFMEIRLGMNGGGNGRGGYLGAARWLDQDTREMLYAPFAQLFGPLYDNPPHEINVSSASSLASGASEAVASPSAAIASLLSSLANANADPSSPSDSPSHALILRAQDAPGGTSDLSTELHPPDAAAVIEDETLKRWEQLDNEGQNRWVKRLKDAGHWVEGQTEAVLKGVLFSEVAGVVGGLAGGG